jgi:hypothetical protein
MAGVRNTGHTQKNGAMSKVNKKFISQLTRTQRAPSAMAAVQVSRALPAVRFSCLLRGRFALVVLVHRVVGGVCVPGAKRLPVVKFYTGF